MKTRARLTLTMLTVAIFCLAGYLALPGRAEAQPKKPTPVEGAVFNEAASMPDNLKVYLGKEISVHLKSGKTLQGYVKSVGNGLLHLERLAGKEFYDALILIPEISAIEARFRELK